MSDPAKLREASEKVLYGLRADDTLKQKILMKAAAGGDTGSRRAFRPLPVFCGVVAALLVAVIALNGLEPAVPAGSVEINVFAAGDNETVPPAEDGTGEAAVLAIADPDQVVSVELKGVGTVTDPEQCASLLQVLTGEARPASDGVPSPDGVLKITYSSGDVALYQTKEPYLTGDASWTCQGFFSLFRPLADQ